jgi:hypothetical protein
MNDDKAAIESEITDIRTNAENPLYQRFQNGEPQANEHVQNLYRRLRGVEPVAPPERRIQGELSAAEEQELKAEIERERLSREGEIDQKAVEETVANVRWSLQQVWGKATEKNLQLTNAYTVEKLGSIDEINRLAVKLGVHRHPEAQALMARALHLLATARR